MFLNLKLVQQRENLLGLTIVRGYKKDPAKMLDLIREHFMDNPESVIKTLGDENIQALGLFRPLEKFQYYFPIQGATAGLNGLVYRLDNEKELLACMVRAKVMIADLRLPLIVRTDKQYKKFRLYIDKIHTNEIPKS